MTTVLRVVQYVSASFGLVTCGSLPLTCSVSREGDGHSMIAVMAASLALLFVAGWSSIAADTRDFDRRQRTCGCRKCVEGGHDRMCTLHLLR